MVSLNLLVVSLNLHMVSLNLYIVSLNLRVVSLNLHVDAGSWRDHKVSVDQSAGADQLVLPLIPHPDNGDHPAVHHRARHLPTLQHIRQQARQAQYEMLHWYVWARCNKKKQVSVAAFLLAAPATALREEKNQNCEAASGIHPAPPHIAGYNKSASCNVGLALTSVKHLPTNQKKNQKIIILVSKIFKVYSLTLKLIEFKKIAKNRKFAIWITQQFH